MTGDPIAASTLALGKSSLRSIRARMTALFAFFVALLMLAGGAEVQHREFRRAEKLAAQVLDEAADHAQEEIRENGATRSLLQIARDKQSEFTETGLITLVVAGDEILWQSRAPAPPWPRTGDDWRIRTINSKGQTLVFARSWKPVKTELAETARSLWELGFLVVLATGAGAWFVVGKTLSPLYALADQARDASIDSLQVRLQTPSSDSEMRYLTATINGLLARLENEARARGRFYAAASHELRTPLQVLLGEIDVARSRPRSVAQHEAVLCQLESQTQRLADLVQELLQLNALEMRQSQPPREEIHAQFWIERALEQQRALMEKRDLGLEARISDAVLCAPPTHLEILLRNLLENAAKYGAPGSAIRVTLAPATPRNGAVFSVCNACALAGEEDVSGWFEPFFRPDAARSGHTGGNGLGLSLCRAVCESNGWQIALQRGEGELCARVEFGGGAVTP